MAFVSIFSYADLTAVFVESAKQAPAFVVFVLCVSLMVWRFLKHIREGEKERTHLQDQQNRIQASCLEAVKNTTSDCREFQRETLTQVREQFDRMGAIVDRNTRVLAKNTSMIEAIYSKTSKLENGEGRDD